MSNGFSNVRGLPPVLEKGKFIKSTESGSEWAQITAADVEGGGGGLPADTVVAAGTRIIANKVLVGDANNAWRVLGDGKQEWGPGGATALDTNLYRDAATSLRTNAAITSTRAFWVERMTANASVIGGYYPGEDNSRVELHVGDGLWFGPGGTPLDTNLYRSAAQSLKTDGAFYVGANLFISNDAGAIYFGSANDTYLVRTAPNSLATAASITTNISGAGLTALMAPLLASSAYFAAMRQAGDAQWRLVIDANGAVYWGPGGASGSDTRLYRAFAGGLATDYSFLAGGSVYVDTNGVGNKLFFGSSADTNLYRSAAGVLKTDGIFNAVGGLQVNGVPVGAAGDATVACSDNVAGLGTPHDGMMGKIRVGGSAAGYKIITVVYDSTLGKWVSEETTVWSTGQYLASPAPTNGGLKTMGYFAVHSFADLLAAGLRPQFRWAGMSYTTYGALNAQFTLAHGHVSPSFGTGTTDFAGIGNSIDVRGYMGSSWAGFDIGWNPLVTVPGSPKAILETNVNITPDNSATSDNGYMIGSVFLRWVSA